jgi:hypothetical protein
MLRPMVSRKKFTEWLTLNADYGVGATWHTTGCPIAKYLMQRYNSPYVLVSGRTILLENPTTYRNEYFTPRKWVHDFVYRLDNTYPHLNTKVTGKQALEILEGIK